MSHDFIDTRYDDLRIATTARTGASAPSLVNVNSTGIYAYEFTSTNKELHFSAQLPHGWNKGIIKPHIHWLPSVTWTSGTCTFTLDYIVGKPTQGAVWSAKQTLTVNSATSGTAWTSQISSFSDIDLSNLGGIDYTSISTLLLVRLAVTANSMSPASTPFLVEFDIHFARNRMGTVNAASEP